MKAIGFLVSVNCSHASFTLDAEKSQLLGNSNNNKRKALTNQQATSKWRLNEPATARSATDRHRAKYTQHDTQQADII